MDPIIPVIRREPLDDPAWLFELKFDGFRGVADTIQANELTEVRRFSNCLMSTQNSHKS
jgi:ATP-dependent DNA ligase